MTHPTPQGQLSLPVVAYGYENTRPTGERTALMMVKLDNSGDQYPELATKLVRLSDAQAATDSLRAEVEAANRNAASALDLVSRIRFALGDNGKRMQPELIEWCKELVAQRAELVEQIATSVEASARQAPNAQAKCALEWEALRIRSLSQQSGSEVKNGTR